MLNLGYIKKQRTSRLTWVVNAGTSIGRAFERRVLGLSRIIFFFILLG